MRNSRGLPIISLIAAAILALVVTASHEGEGGALTELELGGAAWVIGLTIYGLQGLISIAIEGQELRPGRMPAHLTDPLSLGIAILSLAVIAIAALLGYGISSDWGPSPLGVIAGIGCIAIAFIAVFYKEGFLGDEASFDERDDGVPW
jgi:hypothetical protein